MANSAVVGANATCTQVAVGGYAALTILLTERPQPCIYFASDLYDTVYRHVAFSNMCVEHYVCDLRRGQWIIGEHNPELHLRPRGAQAQPVI